MPLLILLLGLALWLLLHHGRAEVNIITGQNTMNRPNQVSAVDPVDYRIGDIAQLVGVSTRTLRYYEELGLLSPSGHTQGGERRYSDGDLAQLKAIKEYKELLGMNLDEVRAIVASQIRLDELRTQYHAQKGKIDESAIAKRKSILEEALELRQDLLDKIDQKLARMNAFRSQIENDTKRCRNLLDELSK